MTASGHITHCPQPPASDCNLPDHIQVSYKEGHKKCNDLSMNMTNVHSLYQQQLPELHCLTSGHDYGSACLLWDGSQCSPPSAGSPQRLVGVWPEMKPQSSGSRWLLLRPWPPDMEMTRVSVACCVLRVRVQDMNFGCPPRTTYLLGHVGAQALFGPLLHLLLLFEVLEALKHVI
jgi:hypothetical protein